MEVFRPVGEEWSLDFCQFPVRRHLSGHVLSEIFLLWHHHGLSSENVLRHHDLSPKNVLLQSLFPTFSGAALTLHGDQKFRFPCFY